MALDDELVDGRTIRQVLEADQAAADEIAFEAYVQANFAQLAEGDPEKLKAWRARRRDSDESRRVDAYMRSNFPLSK